MPWTLISRFIFAALIPFFVLAKDDCKNSDKPNLVYQPRYARGFKISSNSQGVVQLEYRISKNDLEFKKIKIRNASNTCPEEGIIINSVALASSGHLAPFLLLKENQRVKAISRRDWFFNQDAVEDALELGYPTNIELAKKSKVSLLIANAVTELDLELLNKIESHNIPVLIINEYLEEEILGRAEWIIFIGALVGKLEESQKIFQNIERDFQSFRQKVTANRFKNAKAKKVLLGFWDGNFWISSNPKSNIVSMLKDLGAEPLRIARDFVADSPEKFLKEEVIRLGKEADYCLFQNNNKKSDDLVKAFPELTSFKCFSNKKLINNTKKMNKYGSNDFWETSGFRPDLLIRDLANVLEIDSTLLGSAIWYEQI
jgi:iron complex transport system substrate-binding protein